MKFFCSLWRGRAFGKPVAEYGPDEVHYLARALSRFGHTLTCITDGSFNLNVDQVKMPKEVCNAPDYQPKLWVWSEEVHDLVGEPFAHIDLDCIVLGDPALVFDKTHALNFWDWAKDEPYNTSLMYITPGEGHEVWANRHRIEEAKENWDYWTGDQSLVGWTLGGGHKTFGATEGIRNFGPRRMLTRPAATRVVFFCGSHKPKDYVESHLWVKQEIGL